MIPFCVNIETWATFQVTSLDALGVSSRAWPEESWSWGSHLRDGRRDQTASLGAWGEADFEPSFILHASAVTSCVLPPILSPPASDLFLKVLTHVGNDVLGQRKLYLSESWCWIGLIAVTPSKLILSCADSLVVVQLSSHWWATPLLCFHCVRGVGSIHCSKCLTLLPCLPAQCAHFLPFSWPNLSVWEFTLRFGDWSDQSEHVGRRWRHFGSSPCNYLFLLLCCFLPLPYLPASWTPQTLERWPGSCMSNCLTSSFSSCSGIVACGLFHAEEMMLFKSVGFWY